ncbi:MAG: substrate-binding domain-containing protein [Anaerolineales bacterium]
MSDARRLAVMRLLMRAPATLSQLGDTLGMSAARVRHHLKILEAAGFVQLIRTRRVGGFTEKYYQASAPAYFIQRAVLPAPAERGTLSIIGSHDPALESLVETHNRQGNGPELYLVSVGSLDGLIALRLGFSQVAGCHLHNPDDESYNVSFVRHLFPADRMGLITFAHRQQGLLVAAGNPLGVVGVQDLVRPDLTFVNRRRGSGTRLWLDQQLQRLGSAAEDIEGYQHEVDTHSAVAAAIESGQADAGIAVMASAVEAGLGFVPLFEERFDLAFGGPGWDEDLAAPLFDELNGARARRLIAGRPGYRSTDTGKTVDLDGPTTGTGT